MDLPSTLHGQLYLLAYDRNRRKFVFDHTNAWNPRWRFGYAMRAAMLTDLYLGGYVENRDGKAYPSGSTSQDDPALDDLLSRVSGRTWEKLVTVGGSRAIDAVRDQLETSGWIARGRRRMFGVLPAADVKLYDEDVVGGFADRVTGALRNILDGLSADPRPLALGLIAMQAQLPVVEEFIADEHDREQLREMTLAAIEPILALHHAVIAELMNSRSGGGCGGGGCGGGG